MEEHTDLFSQFGMVLKTRSRATECSDNYMMSAVAYFEVGDYESAARCFSKADMALMMHRDILEKWGKFQNFLHQVARNKQGLCELPDGWFDMDIMTQFLDLFGEFQALPNALKTAYSL
jgi:hypothetical protein